VFIEPVDFPETLVTGQAIDWQRTPLILAEQGLSRVRIDRMVRKGNRPNIYAEVAGNEALLAMVSLGCGVGVVPLLVLEKSPLRDRVRRIDAEPRLLPFTIGACTAKKNLDNPVIAGLLDNGPPGDRARYLKVPEFGAAGGRRTRGEQSEPGSKPLLIVGVGDQQHRDLAVTGDAPGSRSHEGVA
jgi:hypothetical protein